MEEDAQGGEGADEVLEFRVSGYWGLGFHAFGSLTHLSQVLGSWESAHRRKTLHLPTRAPPPLQLETEQSREQAAL